MPNILHKWLRLFLIIAFFSFKAYFLFLSSPTNKQKTHGTAVSSIAIGRRADDGSPMHGVAFDAKVFFIAVQLGSAPEDYDPVDLGDSSGGGSPDYSGIDNFYDQVFEIFIDNGVDVINNSFGYTGTIIEYTEEQLRTNFPNTIERIASFAKLASDPIYSCIVIAFGVPKAFWIMS